MPDITMCKGIDCKIKEGCARYNSKPSEYQSFFSDNKEACISKDNRMFMSEIPEILRDDDTPSNKDFEILLKAMWKAKKNK